MTTTTITSTAATIIASVACIPGTPQRGSLDLRTALSARITIKVTNGATGPTVAPNINILMASSIGAVPTLASRNADWKTLYQVAGDTAANSINEWNYTPPVGCWIEVECKDNTGQNVTIESHAIVVTGASSV